jgi:molybdenum cofactor cytidylyltransferase
VHALGAAEKVQFLDPIAVTGRDSAGTEALAASFGFQCIFNPRFTEGLGTSIAAGAGTLSPDISGVVIALGDMPAIGPESYHVPAAEFYCPFASGDTRPPGPVLRLLCP